MIVIHGTISFAPENQSDVLAAVATLVGITRTEAGCADYTFSIDVDGPGKLHIFEEWADDESLGAHMKADHYRAFGRSLRGFGVAGTSIDRYEVSSKSKLA